MIQKRIIHSMIGPPSCGQCSVPCDHEVSWMKAKGTHVAYQNIAPKIFC